MRLTRIHVDAELAAGGQVQLPSAQARHLVTVLRLQGGAPLRVFNGRGGEWDANIDSIARKAVIARIGTHHAIERESPLQVTLLQGIARGEKMDFILQKATELGVAAVVPLTTTRSSVRLDDAAVTRKHSHWQGVLVGACEQSGRNRIPALARSTALATAVCGGDWQLKLLLEPDADSASMKTLLAAAQGSTGQTSICLLAGPEGGIDPQEAQLAKQSGFVSCQLGPRVLRTETAALAALAALQALAGDFN